jgi:uncharacterized membrane protein
VDKRRLEAFSDGVIAILITIMVLGLRPPQDAGIEALRPLVPTLLSYVLSFVLLGIYWNNHHHLLQAVDRVDGRILWANLHLLFWLSLIPFGSAWLGQTTFAAWPAAIYGGILFFAAVAYFLLVRSLVARHGPDSMLATAVGSDVKGKISLLIPAAAIPLAFANSWLASGLYVVLAAIWLVPDRRIEKTLSP